jgi:hypothetical protein
MNPETLNEQLSREPFTPLRLTLTTGETVDITDPGAAFIAHLALQVFGVRKRGQHIADWSKLISLRHIVKIEPIEPAAAR